MTSMNVQEAHAEASQAVMPDGTESGSEAVAEGLTWRQRRKVWLWRIVVIAVILSVWQWVPDIHAVRRSISFADPFFISSPARVAREIWRLSVGSDHTAVIWPGFLSTMGTALVGTAVATVGGALAGLFLSDSPLANSVARPFLVFFNAIPRITMIPIILLIAGPGNLGDAVAAVTVVFFLIFYSAFEGGSAVPREMIQNARLLGGRKTVVMLRVRGPYVVGWTIAALPNAIAFGIVGVVTTELFSGGSGIGEILTQAIYTTNADLTFGVVVILALAGVLLVLISNRMRRLLVPWWESSEGA